MDVYRYFIADALFMALKTKKGKKRTKDSPATASGGFGGWGVSKLFRPALMSMYLIVLRG